MFMTRAELSPGGRGPSGGGTGLLKPAVLTGGSLVAGLCLSRLAQRVAEDDVAMAAPLFHFLGQQAAMLLTLVQLMTAFILPRFEVRAFLGAVQDHGVARPGGPA